MADHDDRLLLDAARRAAAHRAGVAERPHRPRLTATEARRRFAAPTPEHPSPAEEVIGELATLAEPGLGSMTGPRFFGWVIGGSHPAGVAADWLTSAWGQNAASAIAAPAAAAAESVAAGWLLDLLDLPREAAVGFVTGATMANFTALAAARGEVLRRVGWDCEADGLFGAPPVTVLLGAEAHSTVFAALRYLGFGERRVIKVATDDQGRMQPDAFATALAAARPPLIAIVQAGHINTGAFDPFAAIVPQARAAGAWVHADAAFGLWARAAPDTAALAAGLDQADSWAVDGHKWLQTPYDSGYAIVRQAEPLLRAMRVAASYLPLDAERNPPDLVPELSRRARGFPTWAMLRTLGRSGIAAMVSRHCHFARLIADRLAAEHGVAILNDVVLNQVAVRFGADRDPATGDRLTRATIARLQQDGVCFAGGARWRDREIMRISVIHHATTESDIERSAQAMLAAWRATRET